MLFSITRDCVKLVIGFSEQGYVFNLSKNWILLFKTSYKNYMYYCKAGQYVINEIDQYSYIILYPNKHTEKLSSEGIYCRPTCFKR